MSFFLSFLRCLYFISPWSDATAATRGREQVKKEKETTNDAVASRVIIFSSSSSFFFFFFLFTSVSETTTTRFPPSHYRTVSSIWAAERKKDPPYHNTRLFHHQSSRGLCCWLEMPFVLPLLPFGVSFPRPSPAAHPATSMRCIIFISFSLYAHVLHGSTSERKNERKKRAIRDNSSFLFLVGSHR